MLPYFTTECKKIPCKILRRDGIGSAISLDIRGMECYNYVINCFI